MSFSKMATSLMTTKGEPTLASGKFGDPEDKISDPVAVLPVMPITPEIAASLELEEPFEVMETFAEGDIDIQEGDIATIDSLEYEVVAVGDWPWPQTPEDFKRIMLRQVKK